MKNDTTFVRMRSGDHLGDAKCRKRAPRFVKFNFFIKVARNEVKNASFAQRSAHRECKNMATGIDRTGRRAQATRAQTTTDVQSSPLQPIYFATVQYFIQLPPIMFGFSESADIGLSY